MEQARIIELVKELQSVSKETGWNLYINANKYGDVAVRMIYVRNHYSLDSICIKEKEEKREVDGVKIDETVLAYIPKKEFDPLKHEAVGE